MIRAALMCDVMLTRVIRNPDGDPPEAVLTELPALVCAFPDEFDDSELLRLLRDGARWRPRTRSVASGGS
jgi:hypothetical protein